MRRRPIMAFKASIEVDTVDEFKKLNETKVIEVPKIVYKDRVKKVKEPVEKIVEKEVVKEVFHPVGCQICGCEEITIHHDSSYPVFGNDGVERQYKTATCTKCGWATSIGSDLLNGK